MSIARMLRLGSRKMARSVRFRKKKQNRFGMITVSAIVILFCSVIAFNNIKLKAKQDEYNKKIEALEAQIEDEHERTKELEEYEKYTKTSKYVEEVAKEKLGLVYEDEIVFESGVEN